MTLAALLLGLLSFIAALRLLKAQEVASRIVATAQDSIVVISNRDLSDDEKEARIRRSSGRMFKNFFVITGIGLLATGSSVLVVWAGAALGLYTVDEAIDLAVGWPFLIGCSIGAVALWLALDRVGGKKRESPAASEEVPYSPLDKALHSYAFASPGRQKRLGALENRLYRRRIDLARAERPVFVTSLPRAGTTIMLNILAELPEFASATYRHMPFTLSPLLWGGFSGTFRKSGEVSERAHGDGIEVGVDSPEAFEEMLWMAFWPAHFEERRILTWSAADRNAEFESFFRAHMAKIVGATPGARRYVSKNNANIARLALLNEVFPDASIVIPLRDPRSQVASLMRQHARFLELHAREPFARQYMEGIGHFEFGGALKPIAFGGESLDAEQADGPDFWLRNWIGAYEFVLATAGPGAIFVDHDALCADPSPRLALLAEAIGCDDPQALAGLSATFRSPPPPPALDGADPNLLERALELHRDLCGRSLAPASDRPRMEALA